MNDPYFESAAIVMLRRRDRQRGTRNSCSMPANRSAWFHGGPTGQHQTRQTQNQLAASSSCCFTGLLALVDKVGRLGQRCE
jgi:hypothetical protein